MFLRGLFPLHVFHEGMHDKCLSPLPRFTPASLCSQLALLHGDHTGPRPAFPRAVLQGAVFTLFVLVTDAESRQLHFLKGKEALIPQWNVAVLAALSAAILGDQWLCPLCQFQDPELYLLAICGNATNFFLSALIMSEMIIIFLMLTHILVIGMLSPALKISNIRGFLFVFISEASRNVSSATAYPSSINVTLLRSCWTEKISYKIKLQVIFSVSRPRKPIG